MGTKKKLEMAAGAAISTKKTTRARMASQSAHDVPTL
jgi:hypothetical protein